MGVPVISKVIRMSDLVQQAQTKLLEVRILEEAMEITEHDLANIIARSQIQRKLMHIRALELQEVIETLQVFTDSEPTVTQ